MCSSCAREAVAMVERSGRLTMENVAPRIWSAAVAPPLRDWRLRNPPSHHFAKTPPRRRSAATASTSSPNQPVIAAAKASRSRRGRPMG
jgi:hypothetical protein